MKYLKIYAGVLIVLFLLWGFSRYGTKLWNWFPPQDAGPEYAQGYENLSEVERATMQVSFVVTMLLGLISWPAMALLESMGVGHQFYWMSFFISAGWITLSIYFKDQFCKRIDAKVDKIMNEKRRGKLSQ